MLSVAFLLLLIGFVNSVPTNQDEERFVWFQDDNERLHHVDLFGDPSADTEFDPEIHIRYLLYTRSNPDDNDFQVIKKRDVKSLLESNFDVNKSLKITVAGWNSDHLSLSNVLPRRAFLIADDVNVITVDWTVGSQTGYIQATRNVLLAGPSVADFVNWINDIGVPFSKIHVVGNSLGGQMSGLIGRFSKGFIEYITAMDPAHPLWGPNSQRIRKTDGKYVEVIHSNYGLMGMKSAVGHNDFYPNGGRHMPGCGLNILCSHELARHYIAESIVSGGFTSIQCKTVKEALAGVSNCTGTHTLQMGGLNIKPETGIFALQTNDKSPFSKG